MKTRLRAALVVAVLAGAAGFRASAQSFPTGEDRKAMKEKAVEAYTLCLEKAEEVHVQAPAVAEARAYVERAHAESAQRDRQRQSPSK